VIELTPDQVAYLLGPNLATLATCNPDGTAQLSPVWIDYDGRHVLVNTEARRVKVRNVRRDPRVALIVVNRADEERYLHLRGRFVGETAEGAFEHIDRLAKRYMGLEHYPYNEPEDQRVILRIEPDHVGGFWDRRSP
jgi:PPOX class probable F420-dependent enzyme